MITVKALTKRYGPIAAVGDWVVIGAPSSAGAHHAGQEQAPAALRQAGLLDRLREAGASVQDVGDLPGAVFAVDHDHPHGRTWPPSSASPARSPTPWPGVTQRGGIPLVPGGDWRACTSPTRRSSAPILPRWPPARCRASLLPAGLRVMRAHPSFAGLVRTEINPTHDPDGSQLGRYVRGLVSALAAGAEESFEPGERRHRAKRRRP